MLIVISAHLASIYDYLSLAVSRYDFENCPEIAEIWQESSVASDPSVVRLAALNKTAL